MKIHAVWTVVALSCAASGLALVAGEVSSRADQAQVRPGPTPTPTPTPSPTPGPTPSPTPVPPPTPMPPRLDGGH